MIPDSFSPSLFPTNLTVVVDVISKEKLLSFLVGCMSLFLACRQMANLKTKSPHQHGFWFLPHATGESAKWRLMASWVICYFLNKLIKPNIHTSLHTSFLCAMVANYSLLTELVMREQYSRTKVGKFLGKVVDEYWFIPVGGIAQG